MVQRENWGSRIGVILAVAGSAVGLGNFLRFPGQAAQNGGGAFMIPYFVSLLLLGIPLCWAEWTMGRYGGTRGFHSAPGTFSVICRNPRARYLGAIALLIPLIIYMYYVVIEAWCLGYAISYLDGSLALGNSPEAYEKHFNKFVGLNGDGALFGRSGGEFLGVLIFTFAVNFFFIYRGVTKGIEAFCRVAMPLMVVLAIVVLIRVLTLGAPLPDEPDRTVVNGLGAMWNPKFEKLANPQTWLAASGQIFFSLSVGFGVIINYASYLRRKDDVALSGLTATSVNEFFEVCLGGLITLPAAFIFLGAASQEMGTFSLGFVALPNVFANMPGGQLFGFFWFFMLFIAAITSSLSMLQPVIAFFEEGLGLKRHAAAAILGLLSAIGALFVAYFSGGLVALDTLDFWVGTTTIFVLGLIQSIVYGWIFGIKRGHAELHEGAHIQIPIFVQYMLKYVTPVYLLVVFAMFCYHNVPGYLTSMNENPVAKASIVFIGVVFTFLLILVHIAGIRWIKEGRFDFLLDDDTADGVSAGSVSTAASGKGENA
ncbi:MAG: sodium-dependent transporter [Rubinisphaera brasiliensis]|uniref:Sodium:neurotransmitter symporter n=1 Tax=Rubinisphaera brasiliensis (strain ATCC 49424 / DSM 5305 / JCM 21570 / IAM 15109 / NBRC 103401 / IFAM 1448) TaxID=756272 RepID=F0SL60_RUBBR|nr:MULTISPECIES: sodium-dependent transporter [Rubinisphaera]ADY60943.1 sodium:neurotransmitter symporter [Rubinisphaera brasiliensis DSM 5305]